MHVNGEMGLRTFEPGYLVFWMVPFDAKRKAHRQLPGKKLPAPFCILTTGHRVFGVDQGQGGVEALQPRQHTIGHDFELVPLE